MTRFANPEEVRFWAEGAAPLKVNHDPQETTHP